MADGGPWVEFVAPLEPLVWGRNTYTILPVPRAWRRPQRRQALTGWRA